MIDQCIVCLSQYEDLPHYGMDGVGGIPAAMYGDPLHAARAMQAAVHLGHGAPQYHTAPYSGSAHAGAAPPSMGSGSVNDAINRDKDAIYGYVYFMAAGIKSEAIRSINHHKTKNGRYTGAPW